MPELAAFSNSYAEARKKFLEAAQLAWLRSRPRLPKDTAVVFFHAQNPRGFADKTRATEENVDLNRNFIDFSKPLPPNPGYAELRPLIALRQWDEAAIGEFFAKLDAFRERVGEKAFSDALNGGQYAYPDGIFYRGERPQ